VETEQAKTAAQALFGSGDVTALTAPTLAAALSEAGSVELDASAGIPDVVELLTLTGLAKSKGEARRTVAEGGAYVNNVRVEDPEHVPSSTDLIGGSWLVLRRGKKRFAGVHLT
jgi:tyrosyl-tRNA synthetase